MHDVEGYCLQDNLLSWVEKVTGARCFPRCEEAVNDRKDLASSYLPYLRALNTSLVMEDRETSSVIFYNLVKRGLRDIVNVNDGLLELFTELSLNLAAQFLPGDQVKGEMKSNLANNLMWHETLL